MPVSSPSCHLCFRLNGFSWEVPTTKVLGFVLEWFTELGNVYLPVCYTRIKVRVQTSILMKEMYRIRCVETHTAVTFMGASSHRHDWSLTPFSILFPSQEIRGQGWKFQASNHGLFSWWSAPTQEPTQSCLISKDQILKQACSNALITEEITRVLRVLCQEPGAETSMYIYIYIFYYLTLLLSQGLIIVR